MEFIFGLMGGGMKEVGIKIKCMVWEKLCGKMAEVMKENMKMIKNMVFFLN